MLTYIFKCVLLFFFLVRENKCRDLWEKPVTEIVVTELRKDDVIEPAGNDTHLQITGLKGTLYADTLSKLSNAKEIRIIKNQLEEIEPGSLCSSSNVKVLELDLSGNKNPPILTNRMFDNCSLDELFFKFDFNNPSTIRADALKNLQLETLGIDSLAISTLDKNVLILNPHLKKLVLSRVYLRKMDCKFFDDLRNLEELVIVHNPHLTTLRDSCFKYLSKAKRLSLRDNALKNLSWDEFKGLSLLEELDVTDNEIQQFNADKIAKNMPQLNKLFLEVNPVECDHMEDFQNKIKLLLPQLDVPNIKNANILNPCHNK